MIQFTFTFEDNIDDWLQEHTPKQSESYLKPDALPGFTSNLANFTRYVSFCDIFIA